MPFKRHKPEKPGESSANRGGALGSGDLGKSPFGRTAEHPGYRSKKEQARGGTRRDVVRGKIEDVVETATSHREKELKGKEQLRATAKEIAKERQKRLREEQAAQAKQAAAEQRAREKEASQEQKRVNLAQKTAARKEAEAQRKRDRAQARQDERDRKAAVKAANRAARRGRG